MILPSVVFRPVRKMGEKKKMGKNGHWAKKYPIFFKRKKWSYSKKKKKWAKNGHFKKKCPTTSKPFLDLDSNTISRKNVKWNPT